MSFLLCFLEFNQVLKSSLIKRKGPSRKSDSFSVHVETSGSIRCVSSGSFEGCCDLHPNPESLTSSTRTRSVSEWMTRSWSGLRLTVASCLVIVSGLSVGHLGLEVVREQDLHAEADPLGLEDAVSVVKSQYIHSCAFTCYRSVLGH